MPEPGFDPELDTPETVMVCPAEIAIEFALANLGALRMWVAASEHIDPCFGSLSFCQIAESICESWAHHAAGGHS